MMQMAGSHMYLFKIKTKPLDFYILLINCKNYLILNTNCTSSLVKWMTSLKCGNTYMYIYNSVFMFDLYHFAYHKKISSTFTATIYPIIPLPPVVHPYVYNKEGVKLILWSSKTFMLMYFNYELNAPLYLIGLECTVNYNTNAEHIIYHSGGCFLYLFWWNRWFTFRKWIFTKEEKGIQPWNLQHSECL